MPRLRNHTIKDFAAGTPRADLTPFTVEELEQEGLRRIAVAIETPVVVGDIINELRARDPARSASDIYAAVGTSRRNGYRWSKLREDHAA